MNESKSKSVEQLSEEIIDVMMARTKPFKVQKVFIQGNWYDKISYIEKQYVDYQSGPGSSPNSGSQSGKG